MTEVLTYRGAVHTWHCDHIGHMNVMWYVGKFDEATWNLFAGLGITPSYVREQGRGMAAVQQNIAYKAELLAGDVVEVRSRVAEVREKVIRFVHEMRNVETGAVAAICELTAVHTDRQTRKACPFPADVMAKIQAAIPPGRIAKRGSASAEAPRILSFSPQARLGVHRVFSLRAPTSGCAGEKGAGTARSADSGGPLSPRGERQSEGGLLPKPWEAIDRASFELSGFIVLGGVTGQPVGQPQERWNAVFAVHARHKRRRLCRFDARRGHEQRTLALAAKHGRGPCVVPESALGHADHRHGRSKLLEQTRSQPRLVRAEPDVAVYDIGIGLNPQPLDHGQQQRQLPLVEAARLIVLRRAGHVLGHLRRWSWGCPGLGQHAANACRVMQISDVEDRNRRTHSYRSMHGFAPS